MANNVSNVSWGKPKVGGAVWIAPLGTTLPTDAMTELDTAFKCLGYCSEDGLTNGQTLDSDNVKAWGGDVVLNLQTGFEDTFGLTLIETMNTDVLKAMYGDSNVEGTLAAGITAKVGSAAKEEHIWVVDMILRGNVLRRVVIPHGTITETGEVQYADNAAIGYPITVSAAADADGFSHYEYTKAA